MLNRFSKKNIILGGLWFSKEKPTMSTFMKPFVYKLNTLYHEGRYMCACCYVDQPFIKCNTGIDVSCVEGTIVSHVILLAVTADLPAKAKVANSIQFNGYSGCNTCTIPGIYIEHVMTWDYDPGSHPKYQIKLRMQS